MSHDAILDSSAAEFVRTLTRFGVERVFANAGTDFAPIIEALVAMDRAGEPHTEFLPIAHETLCVAMAHGYHAISRKVPVAMVHTTVGTANSAMGVINAARDHVPLVLLAGRTPVTQAGDPASRSGHIHWGQESFDQGGMLREYLKWDYELRHGQPVAEVLHRAFTIASTPPCGPVYVTLPREVLAGAAPPCPVPPALHQPFAMPPNADALAQLATRIRDAQNPLILTSFAGQNPAAAECLEELAGRWAIPVCQPFGRYVNIRSDHPMHAGYRSGPLLKGRDLIVVIDSDVPWLPNRAQPDSTTSIAHVGADPLFSRLPYRYFRSDLDVRGDTATTLAQLLAMLGEPPQDIVDARRTRIAGELSTLRGKWQQQASAAADATPIDVNWLGQCVADSLPEDAIVVNELGVPFESLPLRQPGSFIGNGIAGGLGMALGAGLGAKMAAPDRPVITLVGNGCYLFGSPTAYHHVARANDLPVLTIVHNNARWQAVGNSTTAVYPDGYAAAARPMPLVDLGGTPELTAVAGASGAWAEKVDDPAELPGALKRALAALSEGQQALLDVRTG